MSALTGANVFVLDFLYHAKRDPLSLKNEPLAIGSVTYLAQVAKWVNLLPIQAPFEKLKRPY